MVLTSALRSPACIGIGARAKTAEITALAMRFGSLVVMMILLKKNTLIRARCTGLRRAGRYSGYALK